MAGLTACTPTRLPSALRFGAAILGLVLLAACGGSPSAPSPRPPATGIAGFTLNGDPQSAAGATWTYRATDAGIAYDLAGVLRKPPGDGRFPAVVISHGYGSNASEYPSRIASEMVTWGLVCIATNYTHAGGVPIGAPGTASDIGASRANVLRAHKLLDLLGGLGYVDASRVAAHGHSLGAFVTTALVAAYPGAFRTASHSAGGILPAQFTVAGAPTDAQVSFITTPYQMHHGDADAIVPLLLDQSLDAVLRAHGVDRQLFVYPGAAHDDVAVDPAVLGRVRQWYAAHGVL